MMAVQAVAELWPKCEPEIMRDIHANITRRFPELYSGRIEYDYLVEIEARLDPFGRSANLASAMPVIHVCPLAEVDSLVETTGASHLVSLLSLNTPAPPPRMIPPERRLAISVSDIAEPMEGHVLAEEEHVAPIIAFARAWPRERPLLIHCWAGISRSTAAAFVSVCALAPHRDEAEIARALREASPSATPNPRIVAVADALLGRSGRMVEAVRAIGRGAEASCGAPFVLRVD